MGVRYICPYWGQEGVRPAMFFARVIEEGYDGVEINIPEDESFVREFRSSLNNIRAVKKDFVFIAQQVLEPAQESVDGYINRMNRRFEFLISLQPDFINSHTGKDYYSFDDNCRIIELSENVASQSGVPVFHETHRGRFTFHAAMLLPYLEQFPALKLTGDFSHWCTVSESMLGDQEHILENIFPRIGHIHARIGFEHSPQVNDPFAPEWKNHVETFLSWWKKAIEFQEKSGNTHVTITPEAGPRPYMPVLPYSQKPVSDQWLTNASMKEMLKRRLEKKQPAISTIV